MMVSIIPGLISTVEADSVDAVNLRSMASVQAGQAAGTVPSYPQNLAHAQQQERSIQIHRFGTNNDRDISGAIAHCK